MAYEFELEPTGAPRQAVGESDAAFRIRWAAWLAGRNSPGARLEVGIPAATTRLSPTSAGETLGDWRVIGATIPRQVDPLPPEATPPLSPQDLGELAVQARRAAPHGSAHPTRDPHGAVGPGLKSPPATDDDTKVRSRVMRLTGYDVEWPVPPKLDGLVWSPDRFLYRPTEDEAGRPYVEVARAVSAPVFLQPQYVNDGGPRHWVLRWIVVESDHLRDDAPYQPVGEVDAASLDDMLQLQRRSAVGAAQGGDRLADIGQRMDSSMLERLRRSEIERPFNLSDYAYYLIETELPGSAGAQPNLGNRYVLVPRDDLPPERRVEAWRRLCTGKLPSGIARPAACADMAAGGELAAPAEPAYRAPASVGFSGAPASTGAPNTDAAAFAVIAPAKPPPPPSQSTEEPGIKVPVVDLPTSGGKDGSLARQLEIPKRTGLSLGRPGCVAAEPPAPFRFGNFSYQTQNRKLMRERARIGSCWPEIDGKPTVPRVAFVGDDPDLPSEIPSAQTALALCSSSTGSVVERGLNFCVPKFEFALIDWTPRSPEEKENIYSKNNVRMTDKNFEWIEGHPKYPGDWDRTSLPPLMIGPASYNFANVVNIRARTADCCIWRQVILDSRCFFSKGGNDLVAGEIPEAWLAYTCIGVVDYGWYLASSVPGATDMHRPREAKQTFATHLNGWRIEIRRFLVQAYCMRRQKVVAEFQWGYEYRNLDPAKPPLQRSALAPWSRDAAWGELRVWVGSAPGHSWGARLDGTDRQFLRDEAMNQV